MNFHILTLFPDMVMQGLSSEEQKTEDCFPLRQ